MALATPRSFGDFLRRIAIDYVRYGYHRYVVRTIPDGKDLEAIDEKLCRIYGVTTCRTTRTRLRRQGLAVIQYLRWQHIFVLLVTDGHSANFEKLHSYDIRDTPLHLGSYLIGLRGNTVSIQVAHRNWSKVKKQVAKYELRNLQELEKTITALPYYHFPGVVRQKWHLLQAINNRRKQAGLPLLDIPRLLPSSHPLYRTKRSTKKPSGNHLTA